MVKLGRLFKKERPAPPVVGTDEVVPVHLFDDLPGYRKTLLLWTFQFNDVLDAEKLHGSLSELIEKGDGWRKLGGRLRLNVWPCRSHQGGVELLMLTK